MPEKLPRTITKVVLAELVKKYMAVIKSGGPLPEIPEGEMPPVVIEKLKEFAAKAAAEKAAPAAPQPEPVVEPVSTPEPTPVVEVSPVSPMESQAEVKRPIKEIGSMQWSGVTDEVFARFREQLRADQPELLIMTRHGGDSSIWGPMTGEDFEAGNFSVGFTREGDTITFAGASTTNGDASYGQRIVRGWMKKLAATMNNPPEVLPVSESEAESSLETRITKLFGSESISGLSDADRADLEEKLSGIDRGITEAQSWGAIQNTLVLLPRDIKIGRASVPDWIENLLLETHMRTSLFSKKSFFGDREDRDLLTASYMQAGLQRLTPGTVFYDKIKTLLARRDVLRLTIEGHEATLKDWITSWNAATPELQITEQNFSARFGKSGLDPRDLEMVNGKSDWNIAGDIGAFSLYVYDWFTKKGATRDTSILERTYWPKFISYLMEHGMPEGGDEASAVATEQEPTPVGGIAEEEPIETDEVRRHREQKEKIERLIQQGLNARALDLDTLISLGGADLSNVLNAQRAEPVPDETLIASLELVQKYVLETWERKDLTSSFEYKVRLLNELALQAKQLDNSFDDDFLSHRFAELNISKLEREIAQVKEGDARTDTTPLKITERAVIESSIRFTTMMIKDLRSGIAHCEEIQEVLKSGIEKLSTTKKEYPAAPESSKERMKILSIDEVKDIIRSEIGNAEFKGVSLRLTAKILELKPMGEGKVKIDATLSALLGDIILSGQLVNTENAIKIESPKIKVPFLLRALKGAMEGYLPKLPDGIKAYLEKREGKKISKIHIVGGGLSISFEE